MLKVEHNLGTKKGKLFTEYKLLTNQFGGTYKAKCDRMGAYMDLIRSWVHRCTTITIAQKPINDV